jgi:hypothetical protein
MGNVPIPRRFLWKIHFLKTQYIKNWLNMFSLHQFHVCLQLAPLTFGCQKKHMILFFVTNFFSFEWELKACHTKLFEVTNLHKWYNYGTKLQWVLNKFSFIQIYFCLHEG